MTETRIGKFVSDGVRLLKSDDPGLYELLERELDRQTRTLMMVAASSAAHPSVAACEGSPLINVTTEDYPGARFHAGSAVADEIERLAIDRAQSVFGAQCANVQPHSCSSANLAVLFALLRPGDTLLGFDLDSGSHLTHGSRASVTGRYFSSIGYGVDADGFIDYDQVRDLATVHRPKVIIRGASAYPRTIDFAAFRDIADSVGAYLIADISHIAGLVVAGLHRNPVDVAHITTTSTYKQLYGPRGGLILLQGSPAARAGRTRTRAGHRASDLPADPGDAEPCRDRREGAGPAVRRLRVLQPDCRAHRQRRLGLSQGPALAWLRGDLWRYRQSHGHRGRVHTRHDRRCCGTGSGAVRDRGEPEQNTRRHQGRPDHKRATARYQSLALRTMNPGDMYRTGDLLQRVLDAIRPTHDTAYQLGAAVAADVSARVLELCRMFPLPAYPTVG